MREILSKAKTVSELLKSCSVDYYQRECKWLEKKVRESNVPFVAHPQFEKDDLEGRSDPYRQIAGRIGDPADLRRANV